MGGKVQQLKQDKMCEKIRLALKELIFPSALRSSGRQKQWIKGFSMRTCESRSLY